MRVQHAVVIGGASAPFGSVTQTGSLERRAGLSQAEFVGEYQIPRRPVILTDAARAWPIHKQCSPDNFRARFGWHKVHVRGIQYRLADLLDLLEASTDEEPSPYPCKFSIPREFGPLLSEISPRFEYSLPDRQANPLVPKRLFRHLNSPEVFFGGRGGQFPYLHYDVLRLHAWITQLHGDTEFTLFAPGQEDLPDANPNTPLQTVVIRAGETLFLPCGWWHTARSLNVTISIAFDQLGPDNWPAFTEDVVAGSPRSKPFRTWATGAYLRAIDPLLSAAERWGVNKSTRWRKR